MAAKISVPSPQIFTSDPLEQIFGRGVLDRDMSGLAYMFMNALGERRRMDQDAYMTGVGEANQLGLKAALAEAQQKQQEALLKAGTALVEKGNRPSLMPIMDSLFARSTPGQMDEMAMLEQMWKRAQIGKANAEASNVGGDKVEVKTDVGPGGAGFTTIGIKGRDPASLQERQRQMVLQQLRAQGLPENAASAQPDAQQMLNRRGYQGVQ